MTPTILFWDGWNTWCDYGYGAGAKTVVYTKNVQSLSDDRFDELCLELQGLHWDMLMVTETCRE